jgi:predicted transposase/invertase (TIGR01784 family)
MKEKYINFFTDFGFKRLFGEEASKDLLIDFLNTLLADIEKPIVELSFSPNEHLGASPLDRKAVFDLYCTNQDGEKFIVEMQKAKQKFFKERSLFYSTFPIREQAEQGEWNFRLKAIYTIGILDFVFDEDKDDPEKYHYVVKLSDIDTTKVFYDKLTFVYLEMPKFNKKESELENRFDQWMYALKNLTRLEKAPSYVRDAIFEKFFEIARIAKLGPDEMLAYEHSLKYYRDLNNVITTAHEEAREKALREGLQKGIEQGIEQGRQEGIKEIAKAMVEQNIPIQTISKITGLSIEQIQSLS